MALGSGLALRYGFDSEMVDFHRDIEGPDTNGWRADLMPRVALDLTGPGYFVRPALAYRVTQYELDTLGPDQLERAPSRTLPIASFDAGHACSSGSPARAISASSRWSRACSTSTCRTATRTSCRCSTPRVPDLNPVELFRTNRYVGADRVSDANQVSVGVTSRLLDAGAGRQFLAGTLGQTYYFQTPRVTLPFEAPISGKRSDFVAQIALTAFQDWSADIDLQWDPANQRSERTLMNVQYKPAENSVDQPRLPLPALPVHRAARRALLLAGLRPAGTLRRLVDPAQLGPLHQGCLRPARLFARRGQHRVPASRGGDPRGTGALCRVTNTAPAAGGCVWGCGAS